jgi:hypothetical protein
MEAPLFPCATIKHPEPVLFLFVLIGKAQSRGVAEREAALIELDR